MTLSGASISVLGLSAKGTGGLTVSSSTVTLSSTTEASTIAKLSFSGGTINGTGSLALTGQTTWSGGTIELSGTTTSSGALTVTGTSSFLQGPLTNSGTLTLPANADLQLETPAVLTNAAAGTIDFAGSGSEVSGFDFEGKVVNNGTIKASLTSGTATITAPLTTSLSKLKMAAGTETVSLANGGSLSGALTVPSGAIFSMDGGAFTSNGASFSGTGLARLTAGTATLTGTNAINSLFSFSGGTINGTGSLALTGQTTWSGGTIELSGTTTSSGALTVTGTSSFLQGPLTNSGTLTLPANADLQLETPAVLTNAAAGTIDFAGSGSEVSGFDFEGKVVNNGTIKASLTSGTATITAPLTTSLSKLKMAAGTETVSLANGGSLSGALTVPSGAIFSMDGGAFTSNGASFSGTGLARLTAGTATLTGTNAINSLFSFSGGTINGTGSLALTGQTTWSGGTIELSGTTTSSGALTVTGTSSFLQGPLTNSGTLTLPANADLQLETPAVLTNAAAGTIDFAGSGSEVSGFDFEGKVVNNGTIKASLTSGTATITAPLTNSTTGVINLGTATLEATDGFTNSGLVNIGFQTFNIEGGMTLNSKGTIAFDVSSSAQGTLTSATRTKLGGHVSIALASGYTPAVGKAVTLVTTTGTQTGSFIVDSSQTIGSTNTGWKMASKGNKVTVTVRPLSDVAGTITAPATATATVPFTVSASVSNNGPEAASSAAVTLALPTGITISGSLPASCTQPTTTTVKCTAGSLAASSKKTFPVTLVASASGSDSITASATTANADLVPGNNKESVVVTAI